ncbi:MAG: V-type ATP synthase subunit E [Firmicutes bacterium ADurb.Bin506]|nr:MAG: V-type ATP synthase subunit E [Firmicutes bacterium ADurb.Bin506]
MDNLDRLKSVILQEARDRAAAIVAEARARGERVVQEARARGEKSVEEAVARAEQAAAENERRAEIGRSLSKRNATLKARGDMVDTLISEIPEGIRALGKERYLQIIRKMMLEAAPAGKVDVVVSTRDKALISDAFLSAIAAELGKQGRTVSFRLAGYDESIKGGFLLKTETLEVDCSLDALVAMSEDELAPLVAEALFGGR